MLGDIADQATNLFFGFLFFMPFLFFLQLQFFAANFVCGFFFNFFFD